MPKFQHSRKRATRKGSNANERNKDAQQCEWLVKRGSGGWRQHLGNKREMGGTRGG